MNRRDIDLLSSYLDGQLKPSEIARLETRLSTEPDLRGVLDDMRVARRLLRQLPMRKAPRNFTLTPKMVGKNPPLPRSYPAFRFVTALASLMLFFSMGLNFLAPQLASQPAGGFGMGGGAPEIFSAEEAPAAPEAAATEAPAEEPSIQMMPLPTATLATADTAREMETPVGNAEVLPAEGAPDQSQLQKTPGDIPPPVSPVWQIVLAGIVVLGALGMVIMRQLAASRWRRKQ